MEGTVPWADLIVAVAEALAARPGPAEGVSSPGPSMLGAVTGAAPLRPRSQRAGGPARVGSTDVGPVIAQTELPVRMLASGLPAVAAQVAAGRLGLVRGADPACGNDGQEVAAVAGIVAVAALSTLWMDQASEAAIMAQVRERAVQFGAPNWTQALDALAERTAELRRLLAEAAGLRHQSWPGVAAGDQYLAEAVAAAVIGGAAWPSGVPPQQWSFPFHLFCQLGVSAALASARTIERWLGIEFLPLPGTPDRLASLAVLVAAEASSLWRGCGCKVEINANEVAYAPRGPCRQADHDLAGWRPGQPKPGSQRGTRYAATLWGWQRRWLGGANISSAAWADGPERPRLRSNDVASSVLVRSWLSTDRGYGGPVLLYDRILPEFCLSCGHKVELSSRPDPDGRHIVKRLVCCADQRLVYRSEFTWRAGRLLIKPKLGLIVAWPGQDGGTAGYGSTAPLGTLWLCRRSGRYSRSGRHCPAAECESGPAGEHESVHHGWVLLPLADAWADLNATAGSCDDETVSSDRAVRDEDLEYLARICRQLPPGNQCQFTTPGEVWALAKGWSKAEMYGFTKLAGTRGLELLLQCKGMAERPASTVGNDQYRLNSVPAAGQYSQGRALGSECSDRGD